MKYSLDWLLDQHHKGEKIKYIFFWGHHPKKDGSIDQSCFSQWWQAPFSAQGIEYKTAEHWIMANKARLFEDAKHFQQVLACFSPAEAKKIGRLVDNFDSQMWDKHKYEFVRQGNYHKFSQHTNLQEYLVNTGDRVLVEASPVDCIWGIGLAKTDKNIYNPAKWKGENLLGFDLMEVREKLKR
jgi:ribA/ribD-fused uncharacterized protein